MLGFQVQDRSHESENSHQGTGSLLFLGIPGDSKEEGAAGARYASLCISALRL